MRTKEYIKNFFKSLLPSAVRFIGPYSTWDQARAISKGYNDSALLNKIIETSVNAYRQGKFERDGVMLEKPAISWPLIALINEIGLEKRMVTVLDFGGGSGSSYNMIRHLIASDIHLDWVIVEQEEMIEAVERHGNPLEIRFLKNLSELISPPEIILVSGVLQYLQEPKVIIEQLLALNARFILIDRTPFCVDLHDSVYVQCVSFYGEEVSYPVRFLSFEELTGQIHSYKVIDHFKAIDGNMYLSGAKIEFDGVIFKREDT